MIKKLTAIILTVLLMLSAFPLAFAAGTPTIKVSSATAAPGETVNLKVSLSNNPGINTFAFGFDYDTTRLNLVDVTLADGAEGSLSYVQKAIWIKTTKTNGSYDTTYNGDYLNLEFKVLDNAAAGDASVAVTYTQGDISNENEEDVDFALVAGKVTVTTNAQTSGVITVSSATAAPGETVNLKVSISDNPGINTFALGFDYDTTRLNLVDVTLADGAEGSLTYVQKAIWIKTTKTNGSYDTTYNGDYLNLEFKVLDNAAAGDASVAVTYTQGDISNENEEDVDFSLVAGKVTVEISPILPTGDAKITVATVIAKSGQEVEVPITMENNPGVIGVGLRVAYDNALTLVSVTDGGVLGGTMHGTNYNKNPYYLNWANDTATSNITENGVIATLRFKVADDAADGVYAVSLSYDNDDFEIFNYDAETVEFNLAAGGVEVKAYTVGDVDGNGRVNAQDRLILSRYIAQWDGYAERIEDMRAADIDGNGRVNAQDRLILSRYIAQWDGYSSYFEV